MKSVNKLKVESSKFSLDKKGVKKSDDSRPDYSLEKKSVAGQGSKEVNQPKGYES